MKKRELNSYGKALIMAFLFGFALYSCKSGIESDSRITETRVKQNFGRNWEFRRLADNAADESWETVNIPHSMKTEPLVVKEQWQGKAIYRKKFQVPSLEGRKWFFHFEGVMQEAKVSINDSVVMVHKGGYLPFTVDATPFLKEGRENTIRVEVSNLDDFEIPPGKALENLDFNYYGGIYRNVWLIKTNPVYITDAVRANQVNGGGILVHFDSISEEVARGLVKTQIRNETSENKQIQLRVVFTDEEEKRHEFLSSEAEAGAEEAISVSKEISIKNPQLWSPSDPKLYRLKVEVIADGELVDSEEIKTGIRDIRLTDTAFYLNGKKHFINGTNRHQEYPYIGYALSDEAQYRDAYKIKEAGFDFVRLSHYPQSPAFLAACDELGIMVMDAIPGWQFFGNEEFVQNSLQNIRDMARRDRNHPSVIFWENSLNESGMSKEYMKKANATLKAELPYEDTYSAGWIDDPAYDLYIPARQHAKPPFYWNHYEKQRPLFIAEYGDWEYYAQNAGFNQKAFSDLREEERSSRQLRSAGEAGMLQQALNFQEAFNSNLKGPHTVGQANWLMFDYNRGYSPDLESSGIADIFRIPKFSYYFYQSQEGPFTDAFSDPMVFIANFWTAGSSKDVKVFSNTEEVALFLNGKLVARKRADENIISDELPFPPFTFHPDQFEPGTLKAVGYIDGEEVASQVVQTPEEPVALKLNADFSGKNIALNTPDVIFVYAQVVDKNGTVVPTATNKIKFSLEAAPKNAEIVGPAAIKAEAGIATILLRTENFLHPLKIKASSPGLEETEITIENP
ncbi:beta-galactosidase [Christiangramia fulva]|uniref:Beta-galactosidase n=1 Tax=Christiangramia fulva TaxID=2126553 RepID=A0A2R3ZBC2_9FLAO|nr:glycoside hydrolase family 2 TIM barrel-domain containing protein [Christiangramia fulva]AVR47550.1 beta-galactosidase [Christiangramia fulva]